MIRKTLPSKTLQEMPSSRELAQQYRLAMKTAINRLKMEQTSKPVITPQVTWSIPKPPPGVVPKYAQMALDEALDGYSGWAMNNALFAEGQAFLGYPYLAELSQRPEYRIISETWAQEMTRKWIRLVSTGDSDMEDKEDKLKEIEAEMKRLKVQDCFRKCIELDGFFGRAQIYIDLGVDTKDRDELKTPIGDGAATSRLSRAKVKKGSLKHLRVIEPIWTYPNSYNANDPLKPDFFKPSTWFVMGQEIHSTRLLTFIGRPMPDLLKPAYSFGGLSLSQMAKPYIDNWLRTRQSVSDGISNFSIMVLMTDLAALLDEGAAQDLISRADLFNATRDNRGLMVANKDTEDLKNVSMPISGLDHLQAQSQEHMSAVSQIPLVKLTGVSPSGLNATSEYEVSVFYEKVEAQQVAYLNDNLSKILNFVQLSLYGEVDPEIGFVWEPLEALDPAEKATQRKTEADTDIAYITAGVISPLESRTRLAEDEESPYAALDLSEEALPEPPAQPGQETDENGQSVGSESPDVADTPPSTGGAVQQGNAASEKANKPVQSKPVAGAHDSLFALDENDNHDPANGRFASGRNGETSNTPVKASDVTFEHIKKLIGNNMGLHEYDLDNGGKVKAETKVTYKNGEVNTKYLHATIVQPSGKWTYYKENNKGAYVPVASGNASHAQDIALDFNPKHDPDNGQFAEGRGEASGRKNVTSKGLPVDADGNVELIHYSRTPNITGLNPHMYGSGLRGAESKRMQADPHNWVSRSYHYVGQHRKEAGLGNIKYTSKVPTDKLYDLVRDPDHLRLKDVGEGHNDINVYEKAIKKAGYLGYWVDHPSFGGIVAATFDPVTVTQAADAWNESEHPRGQPENKGEFAKKTEAIHAGAKSLAALPKEKIENFTWEDIHKYVPEHGNAAYNLYEAQKILPKSSDKLKRVTENNTWSLYQDQEFIANINGVHYGITKQEDPDEPDDDEKFVYAYQRLDDPNSKLITTTTDDKDELIKELKAAALGTKLKQHNDIPTAQDAVWEESKHPRGQPENAGEFAKVSGGGSTEAVHAEIASLKKKLARLGDEGAHGNKTQATRWRNQLYRLEDSLKEQKTERKQLNKSPANNSDAFWKELADKHHYDPVKDDELKLDKAAVQLWPTKDGSVHIVFIHSLAQGGGYASKALQYITDMADKHNVTLTLNAAPLPYKVTDKKAAFSKEQLIQWYGRHGFFPAVRMRGEDDYMVRKPHNAAYYPPPKKTLPDDSPLLVDSRTDHTPEAQAERIKISRGMFGIAKPVTGRKPILYVMGGGSGAGKGTLLAKLQEQGVVPAAKDGAVMIDPDEMKQQMKRYKQVFATGDYRASAVVHEDSSQLSKEALRLAKEGHYDIVFDVTMSDHDKGIARIKEFQQAGYEVKMYNVMVADPQVALDRAMKRYERTGRYVDPTVLMNAHKNFNAALPDYEKMVDHFQTYSNNDELRLERSSKPASDEWNESEHPRGQPENAGEFAESGGTSSVMYSEVRDFESKISNEPVEHAQVYDGFGNALLPNGGKTGINNFVHFTRADIDRTAQRDAIFTHNHPKGYSLSKEDMDLAIMLNLKEIRAVSGDHVFVATRIGPKWPFGGGKMYDVYDKWTKALQKDKPEGVTTDAALSNIVMQQTAKELGFGYRVEKR